MNYLTKFIILLFSVNTFAATQNYSLDLINKTLTSQIPVITKIYNKPVIMVNSVASKKITVSAKNMSSEEAKHIIAKALSLDGISVIETEQEVTFVHAKDALKSGISVYKNKIENPLPERMATLVLDLPKDISAVEMEKSLRSLYSRDGDMKANQQRNQLIISDWTSNLIRIQDVISKSSSSTKTK